MAYKPRGVPETVGKLAPKQRAFCIEYLRTQDAAEAAKAAGYSGKNAGQYGYNLLGREDISAAIDELMYARVVRAGITADRVVNEIASIAFDRTLDVKDRLKALDMLARHHGIYNDKLNVSIDRDTLEQAARDAGVPVEVIEAEYRLITEGKA